MEVKGDSPQLEAALNHLAQTAIPRSYSALASRNLKAVIALHPLHGHLLICDLDDEVVEGLGPLRKKLVGHFGWHDHHVTRLKQLLLTAFDS